MASLKDVGWYVHVAKGTRKIIGPMTKEKAEETLRDVFDGEGFISRQ